MRTVGGPAETMAETRHPDLKRHDLAMINMALVCLIGLFYLIRLFRSEIIYDLINFN